MADETETKDAIPERLPIAPILKPHRLDSYEFNAYDSKHYSFGMDRVEAARVLRETDDRIESAEYILQSAGILSRAERDNYQMTYLTLEFHQKRVE